MGPRGNAANATQRTSMVLCVRNEQKLSVVTPPTLFFVCSHFILLSLREEKGFREMGENEDVHPQTVDGGDAGAGASSEGKKGRYRRDKPWVGGASDTLFFRFRFCFCFFCFLSFFHFVFRRRRHAAARVFR